MAFVFYAYTVEAEKRNWNLILAGLAVGLIAGATILRYAVDAVWRGVLAALGAVRQGWIRQARAESFLLADMKTNNAAMLLRKSSLEAQWNSLQLAKRIGERLGGRVKPMEVVAAIARPRPTRRRTVRYAPREKPPSTASTVPVT